MTGGHFSPATSAPCRHIVSLLLIVAKQLPLANAYENHSLSQQNRTCQAVAMKLMPPPSLTNYYQCIQDKFASNSGHDWSIPGATVSARANCWCQYNITETFQEFGCCNHQDVYPMCSVQCDNNCSSSKALQCVRSCPSMCFEADEFLLDLPACKTCNWTDCWPHLRCIVEFGKRQVNNGMVARTCHESNFEKSPALQNYGSCWRNAPKHSSHWNVLSSVMHCVCREGMINLTSMTSCCDSKFYGGGVCDLTCKTESQCASQEAQSCIHGCQRLCPAYDLVPSDSCISECLSETSSCREYLSCRSPQAPTHVCDDGQWPESSTGCCFTPTNSSLANSSLIAGCPRLCETEHMWRLDRHDSTPWWTRWTPSGGAVTQCTCSGCPGTSQEGRKLLAKTVEESVWDNGQVMLVDVARREGLHLGPNYRMQELMAERNAQILRTIAFFGPLPNSETESRISSLNQYYAGLILHAARGTYPDNGRERSPAPVPAPAPAPQEGRGEDEDGITTTMKVIIAIVVSSGFIWTALMGILCYLGRPKKACKVERYRGENAVAGKPVRGPRSVDCNITRGAPVIITAPTKSKSGDSKKIDIHSAPTTPPGSVPTSPTGSLPTSSAGEGSLNSPEGTSSCKYALV